MQRDIAEKILPIALDCSRRIDESIKRVMERTHPDIAQRYRRFGGRIMGYIFTEIIGPIWTEHPELAPDWFRSKSDARNDEIDKRLRDELIGIMDDVKDQVVATATLAASGCNEDAAKRYSQNIGDILVPITEARSYLVSLRGTDSSVMNTVQQENSKNSRSNT